MRRRPPRAHPTRRRHRGRPWSTARPNPGRRARPQPRPWPPAAPGPLRGPGARVCSARGRVRGRPDGRRRRERVRQRPNSCGRSGGGCWRWPGRHHRYLRTFITAVHSVSARAGGRAGVVRGSQNAPMSSLRPSEPSDRRGPRARPMGTRTPRATSVILVAWTPVLGPRKSGSGSHTADQWFTRSGL